MSDAQRTSSSALVAMLTGPLAVCHFESKRRVRFGQFARARGNPILQLGGQSTLKEVRKKNDD